MIYSSSDIEREGLKLVVLGHFLPFYPLENPRNQNFEKTKTIAGYIIILQMCTKNHNHMMYSSWDTEWHAHNILSFWTTFCTFILLMVSSFYTCTKNHDHMMYPSWDTECDRQNFLSFQAIFCPFTPLGTRKIKWQKAENKRLEEILSFYTCVP